MLLRIPFPIHCGKNLPTLLHSDSSTHVLEVLETELNEKCSAPVIALSLAFPLIARGFRQPCA